MLLNPQWMHTAASGGSSSPAQCGHRGMKLSSTISMGFGFFSSSSSSSRNGLFFWSAALAGSSFGGGAFTGNTSLQSLHLTRFPSYSAGTFKTFPHLGHEISSVADMVVPHRGRFHRRRGHKPDGSGSFGGTGHWPVISIRPASGRSHQTKTPPTGSLH